MRGGDRSTYDEIHARHFDALRAQARRIAPAGTRAGDLAADVFTRFYLDTSGGGGPSGAVRPYLYRLLRQVVAGRRAAPGVTSSAAAVSEFTQVLGITDVVDPRAEQGLRALRSFPEPVQSALWYHDVEGLSSRETARILGVSVSYLGEILVRARPVWHSRAVWSAPLVPGQDTSAAVPANETTAGGRAAPPAVDAVDLARIVAAAALGSPSDRQRRAVPRGRLLRLPAWRMPSAPAWTHGRGAMVAASVAVIGLVGVTAVAATRSDGDRVPVETPDDPPPVETGTIALADPVPVPATAATTAPEEPETTEAAETTSTVAAEIVAEDPTTSTEVVAETNGPTTPTTRPPAGRPPATTTPRRGTTTVPGPFPFPTSPSPTTPPAPAPTAAPPTTRPTTTVATTVATTATTTRPATTVPATTAPTTAAPTTAAPTTAAPTTAAPTTAAPTTAAPPPPPSSTSPPAAED